MPLTLPPKINRFLRNKSLSIASSRSLITCWSKSHAIGKTRASRPAAGRSPSTRRDWRPRESTACLVWRKDRLRSRFYRYQHHRWHRLQQLQRNVLWRRSERLPTLASMRFMLLSGSVIDTAEPDVDEKLHASVSLCLCGERIFGTVHALSSRCSGAAASSNATLHA